MARSFQILLCNPIFRWHRPESSTSCQCSGPVSLVVIAISIKGFPYTGCVVATRRRFDARPSSFWWHLTATESVGDQAFYSKPEVEDFGVGNIGWFAGVREVDRDTILISPKRIAPGSPVTFSFISRDRIEHVALCIEALIGLCCRGLSNGAKQAPDVEPTEPSRTAYLITGQRITQDWGK